jgi:electron-transferring-flavoprotein dehydrogenase
LKSPLERETLDVDVLIVGGGPAGMAAALRLAQLRREAGRDPLSIAVLEKARETGAHELSGAVLDPISLAELAPDYRSRGAPIAADVQHDAVYYLTRSGKLRFPLTPPPLRNHGKHIISVHRFVKWMGELVEAAGVDVFTGFPGVEILFDGDAVIGVRTGDRGVDRHGRQKASFEPGVDIHAKVTIFCDGVRGNLTKRLISRLALDRDSRIPQQYAIGIKELWEVPAGRVAPGSVIHTMGYPLRFEEFGGAFVYAMPEGRLSVGFVAGLNYRDPHFDPHGAFQQFKRHPFMQTLLEGGQMVKYGAKALPEGGWYALPRLYAAGALIAGDAAGFVNSMRLKGIHLAIKSGMLAAEAASAAIDAGDVTATSLSRYKELIDRSFVKRELYAVRNVHQAFDRGLPFGLFYAGAALATNGWWFRDPMPAEPGYARMRTRERYYGATAPPEDASTNWVKPDRTTVFDRLTNVHFSGARHEEDQPVHLVVRDTDVCRTRCRVEYGNPCTRFCPAAVYEMVDDGAGGKRLQINASNCVHCKTCDIEDPYQIIDWVPPEGGGGPQYDGM